VVDLLTGPDKKYLLGYGTAAGLAAIGVLAALLPGLGSLYGGLYEVDGYTYFFRIFFPLTSAFIALLSLGYVRQRLHYPGEYYGILVFATLGMVLMAGAGELITAYISLELLNFC